MVHIADSVIWLRERWHGAELDCGSFMFLTVICVPQVQPHSVAKKNCNCFTLEDKVLPNTSIY